jgi:hypothetical protein
LIRELLIAKRRQRTLYADNSNIKRVKLNAKNAKALIKTRAQDFIKLRLSLIEFCNLNNINRVLNSPLLANVREYYKKYSNLVEKA